MNAAKKNIIEHEVKTTNKGPMGKQMDGNFIQ